MNLETVSRLIPKYAAILKHSESQFKAYMDERLLEYEYFPQFFELVKKLKPAVKKVTCPTLILQGLQDEFVPLSSSQYAYHPVSYTHLDVYKRQVQECLDAPQPFIAVLEGIEDPFNLGYAFRTLYAAGCTGVLMGSRDWQTAQPTIVKSSAGASEQLAWCLCEDLGAAVRQCRQAGCVLYCAQRSDAIDYFDADFNQPIVLAIGGELRGLSRYVLEQSDQNIVIPYALSLIHI